MQKQIKPKAQFIILLLSIFVIMISISSVSAASTVYVNATGGNDSNNGTIDHPYQTIGQGINSVTENGTVYIADGTYSGTGNTNLTITKNMNITGQSQQGTIINGQKSENSIFTIKNGVTVTITNLTLTNGNATYGGAIYNYGTLTVTNSKLTGNNAGVGGAIYNNYHGTLTITNSTLTGNTVTYNGGGAICSDHGTITITNSTLTDNTADVGGAIYNYHGTLTITNSKLTDNKATNYGGAIANEQGTLTITNSTLNNNTATNYGGAIANIDGTLTITNSTLTDNNATYGGAIFNDQGTLTITNSKLTDNTAGYGGAICNAGTLTVTNSTLTDNTADVGGAIYNSDNLTVTNSTLTDNTAGYGGAISNYHGTLKVTNSTLTDNTAQQNGGAIYNDGGSGVVHFNRIVGNSPNTNQIYSSSGIVDATLNWWGSNSSPSSYVNSNVNVASWLVLNITANPTSISNGGNSTVTVDLLHDNTGKYYDPVNGHVPDGTPVTFNLSNTSLGSLNTISTTLKNGKATTKFTAANIGNENVTATIDNQFESTLIIINKSNNNNNTNGKNTTNTVNAATQTIAMQHTGVPLAGLALAILAIFGGMLPRKQ